MFYIGIDTSNYATSLAVYCDKKNDFVFCDRINLTVPDGALGLRQNDAVFLHTKNLPLLFNSARGSFSAVDTACVSVSERPTTADGSYMPCFLAGVSAANAVAATLDVPLYGFSHQQGHVFAAVHSCRLEAKEYLSFHVSGGTTELLSCRADDDGPVVTPIACSQDLHAGQAVDRVGKMLSLAFPAGEALSALARRCNENIKVNPVLVDGGCSLSGVENRCRALYEQGASPEYIAKYCLMFIAVSLEALLSRYDEGLPCIMAGGVSSSSVIRDYFAASRPDVFFCEPRFSCDNAAGTALLGAQRYKKV